MLGSLRPVVPDHKVYFAAFDCEPPADFLCALLNAAPVRRFVQSMTARLQIGALLHTLRLPRFEPSLPVHLALSQAARAVRLDPGHESAAALERMSREVLGL